MITKKVPFRAILLFLIVFSFSPNVQAQKVVRVQLSDIASLFKKKKSKDSKDSKETKETETSKEGKEKKGGVYDISKLHIEEPPESYTKLFSSNETFSEKSKFLRKAIRENNTERAIGFLERGALPYHFYGVLAGERGSEPLYPAIDNKNYDILQAVYDKYPECIRFSQLLHYACSKDFDPKMIDWLIDHGASLDLNGYFPRTLNRAGNRDNYGFNRDDNLYFRPIDVALRFSKFDTVKYLIEKYHQQVLAGAFACFLVEQLIQFVKECKQYGYCDVEDGINWATWFPREENRGKYPLVTAIQKGKNEFAKYIIDHCNADVNVVTTKTSVASKIGINIGDDVYESPFSAAISRPKNRDMINFLIEHGVKTEKWVVAKFAHKEYREDFILQGLID